MKKTLFAIITVGLLLPGSVFAATHTIGGDGDTDKQSAYLGDQTGELFRVSTNVVLEINSTTADYAATSGHLQGTKQYGTTSRFNAIFEGAKTKGSEPTAPSSEVALDSSVFEEFPNEVSNGTSDASGSS
jgi:hypothetical protein